MDGPASGWTARGRGAGSRPLVLGHRGASAHVLENTLAAFERAARDGADGVELDVLCCATGEVMVFHDDDLARVAGRPGRVASLSWAALRAVELPGGHRIPSLDEAFEACGRSLLVNVELQSAGPLDPDIERLVEGVDRSIQRCQTASRVLVSSFDPLAVARWKSARPDLPSALLFESGGWPALGKILALPFLRPAAAHPEASLCTEDRVGRLHQVGYQVNTWTVDDPDRLRALAAMGVDGVISNDPGAARVALGRAGQ
jgi:glycerophosphoryl diester phosphodiesterase